MSIFFEKILIREIIFSSKRFESRAAEINATFRKKRSRLQFQNSLNSVNRTSQFSFETERESREGMSHPLFKGKTGELIHPCSAGKRKLSISHFSRQIKKEVSQKEDFQ